MTEINISVFDNHDGYFYLASPYTKYPSGIEDAFAEVCCAAAWCLKNGIIVYSPIAHTHPVADFGGLDHFDHDMWMAFDRPMMEAAKGIIVCMMPTWELSRGIDIEIAQFKNAGKAVYYLEWANGEGGRIYDML